MVGYGKQHNGQIRHPREQKDLASLVAACGAPPAHRDGRKGRAHLQRKTHRDRAGRRVAHRHGTRPRRQRAGPRNGTVQRRGLRHRDALLHRGIPLVRHQTHIQMTGASWDAQLVAALWAAAFGAAASPLTLLYGIRLRPVERFAADFLATVLIGAAFFLSSETGARGMVTAYCAASFLLSLMLARKGLLRLGALLQKKFPRLFVRRKCVPGKRARATERNAFRDDGCPAPSSSPYNPRRAAGYNAAFPRGKGGRRGRRRQADGWD